MPAVDEMDFGADTDAIRRWLAKRETYAEEAATGSTASTCRALSTRSG